MARYGKGVPKNEMYDPITGKIRWKRGKPGDNGYEADMINRVRGLRESLGWTREKLAKETDLGVHTLYLIEQNKEVPSAKVALIISKALGKPVEQVFKYKPKVQAAA
jgi:DNA-binding XRE family transcriptional regulator